MAFVQSVLDASKAANASTLATGQVSQTFNVAFKNSFKVRTEMDNDSLRYLQRHTQFSFAYTPEDTCTSDHCLAFAQRELTRDVFESSFHISTTKNRVLIVGAGGREIRKYNANPNIHYYLADCENKDYERIWKPALESILSELKAKASKRDPRIFLQQPSKVDVKTVRPVTKRYLSLAQVLDDWNQIKRWPATLHTDYIKSEICVLEDSFYNFGPKEYHNMFERTGCNVCYGYGLLPWELVFEDMPTNPVYNFRVHKNYDLQNLSIKKLSESDIAPSEPGTKVDRNVYATLTWYGYSGGYCHNYYNWSTMLRSASFSYDGKVYVSEIVSRIGVMCIFKVYRAHASEKIVRMLSLPENEQFVRCLDLYASVDHRNCKLNSPLVYFSARATDVFDALNYGLSLPDLSLTLKNIMLFCRRRAGGVSLITKELQPGWELAKGDLFKLAIAIFMECKTTNIKIGEAIANANVTSVWEKFRRMILATTRAVFFPITWIIDLIFQENLTDKIITYPDHTCRKYQFERISVRAEDKDVHFPVNMFAAFANEQDVPDCPFCAMMMMTDSEGQSMAGQQIFDCHAQPNSMVTFKLTDRQLEDFRTRLLDDDGDAPGIAAVKKQAKERLPKSGFEYTCRVEYLKGGPGTGKSFLIKAMATKEDAVYAPFTRLKTDYSGLKDEDGAIYDLNFKTQHRSVSGVGFRRLFIDEFTSFPYEFLATAAYNDRPEIIYLCGDDRQTKTQEPDEGLYIGNYIDLTKLSTHELLVNFRNPPDVVALLNKQFGYKMITFKHQPRDPVTQLLKSSFEFIKIADWKDDSKPCLKYCYSSEGARKYLGNKKLTVRANQGQTTDVSMIYLTADDGNTVKVPELQIVAISRAKDKMIVLHDNSALANDYIQSMGLTQDFYDHLNQWLPIPPKLVKELEVGDKDVDIVLGNIDLDYPLEKAPSDAYLLIKELIPPVATDPEIPSLNEITSHLVKDDFTTARTNEADLYVKQNIRGHPMETLKKWYGVGSGLGNHFLSKRKFQTLAVIAKRYDGAIPRRKFDDAAKKFAEQITIAFFNKYYTRMPDLQEEDVDLLTQRYMEDCKKRNYNKRYDGEGGIDSENDVHFAIKEIFKPSGMLKLLDIEKVAQGISSWGATALTFYQRAFRLMGWMRLNSLNDSGDYTFHSMRYKHELDFMEEFVNACKKHGNNPVSVASTDVEEADKAQNEFTQWIERTFWKCLGISEEFLDAYYRHRSGYKLISEITTSRARHAQTSGSPGTLDHTEIVTDVVSDYVVTSDGPVTVGGTGDDYCKVGMNLTFDEDRMDMIKSYYPVNIKNHIGTESEFCGLTITPKGLYPNLYRRLVKIGGARWRDYNHFTEYQKSLRDYMKLVTKLGTTESVANTAVTNKQSVEWADLVRYSIDSWSHIDEKQWRAVVTLMQSEEIVPISDRHADRGVVATF